MSHERNLSTPPFRLRQLVVPRGMLFLDRLTEGRVGVQQYHRVCQTVTVTVTSYSDVLAGKLIKKAFRKTCRYELGVELSKLQFLCLQHAQLTKTFGTKIFSDNLSQYFGVS